MSKVGIGVVATGRVNEDLYHHLARAPGSNFGFGPMFVKYNLLT